MDASTARLAPPLTDSLMQPFLLYVLARAMLRARIKGQRVSDAELGRALGLDRSTAGRWLDGKITYRRDDQGIDALATAGAQVLRVHPMELWSEALYEWENDPEGITLPSRHKAVRAAWRAGEELPAEA